ncbi:hypothetical protein OH77DRAFT_1394420 [Trametes cingulata]|nr:hypothetical protein OH77DRAFT_1394420 [Trametes cingulata]
MATAAASQPAQTSTPEIIDVDAFEEPEDAVVFTGFHAIPRSQPPRGPTAGPSSSRNRHDDEVTFTGFRRRSPRRALRSSGRAQPGPSARRADDSVIVVDSDEEVPLASSSTSRHASRNRSRLMSPPPPAPQRGYTPGVPPLPHHLASQASLPRRHRAPDVPPPIRPLSRPLAFESRIPPAPRLPPRNAAPAPAPAAAPRSHHQPSMGLGGALLALNRQNALEEANRANQERARSYGGFLPSFSEIWRRVTGQGGEPDASNRPQNNARRWRHRLPWSWSDLLDEDEFLSPFGNDQPLFGIPEHLDAIRRGDRFPPPAEKIPLWKPEYTHPHKSAPGFTFDFAAPDETSTAQGSGSSSPGTLIVLDEDEAGPSSGASASSSATAVETTLVCARCLDPLVLAPANGSSPEDAKMRRVWALRCGHMLDGKCVAELMRPPEAPAAPVDTEPPGEAATSDKGKGKARADADSADAPVQGDETSTAEAAPVQDRKGKRKAVEPLERDEPPKRAAFVAPAEPAEENSIRSRLRSRTRAAADVSPSTSGAAHVTHAEEGRASEGLQLGSPRRGRRQPGVPSPSRLPQGQGGGRAKGKGKGRARVEPKPVIEAEHEWRCPVVGCGCVHYSVRVGGVWTNDEGRGPIALFV